LNKHVEDAADRRNNIFLLTSNILILFLPILINAKL